MKPLLQKNLVSITFVVILTVLGFALTSLLIFNLTEKERLAFILIIISAFFTSVGLFVEILRRSKQDR